MWVSSAGIVMSERRRTSPSCKRARGQLRFANEVHENNGQILNPHDFTLIILDDPPASLRAPRRVSSAPPLSPRRRPSHLASVVPEIAHHTPPVQDLDRVCSQTVKGGVWRKMKERRRSASAFVSRSSPIQTLNAPPGVESHQFDLPDIIAMGADSGRLLDQSDCHALTRAGNRRRESSCCSTRGQLFSLVQYTRRAHQIQFPQSPP